MAENIVREKFPHHAERRSWLNNAEEIQDVLINSKGTDAIEGILFENENLSLVPNSFHKMSKLRFLKIHPHKIQPHRDQIESLFRVGGLKVSYPNGLDSLPNNMRYFHWERYPFKSLPLGYSPEKLVEIRLPHSRIQKLWNGVQDLRNLTIVNLSSSKELKKLPDFSMACNLESMDLTMCVNLHSIHPSILSLPKLASLWLSHCFKLKILHGDNHMKSLKHLVLTGCFRLKEFLLSSEEMTRLDLADTGIETLNLPIGRFNKLEELNLGCPLKRFHINELCCLTSLKKFSLSGFFDKSKLVILFDAWHSLEELYLTECELSEIPDNISAMSSLKLLSLRGSNVESLPSSIMHLPELKLIDLSKCNRLRSLLELPPSITHLYVDDCTSLGAIKFTMMQAILYNKASEAKFCYPGGTIPKGFKYSQTKGRFIAIELPPSSSDHLLGFVCCCILSPGKYYPQTSLWRIFQFEDEEIIYKDEYPFSGLGEVTADNVFIWYDPIEHILKRSQRRILYDEGTTHKFTCEFVIRFYHNHPLFCFDHPDPHIEVCGLCPIYASELQEMDQQMELINLEISRNVSTPNAEMSQQQPSPVEFWKYLAFEPQEIKENVQII